jgi:bacterioferritin
VYEKSIELLNKAVADDLLAGLFKRTAIEEMGHVEILAERILFLKGEVEMVPSMEVQKIHDVRAMLELARKMEEESVKEYNVWANECAANADSASRKVFEDLVADEERHFDQYDTEMENIDKFGDRYLALQSIERSKNIAAGPGQE